jgi:hypothetical protein
MARLLIFYSRILKALWTYVLIGAKELKDKASDPEKKSKAGDLS